MVTFGEATTPTNAFGPIVAPPTAMMACVPPFSIDRRLSRSPGRSRRSGS
jgi:hypothetical protein